MGVFEAINCVMESSVTTLASEITILPPLEEVSCISRTRCPREPSPFPSCPLSVSYP
uniref:Uncharacterized protein n=1 Tax=Vombatus ursinus TaxID=29139 RepID=A0A4X2L6D9_VOMUR